MRNRTAAISIAVVILAAMVVALAWAQTRTEIELTRANIQNERQQIVSEFMQLTDEEADRFWPIYRDYRNEMNRQNDRLLRTADTFAKDYDSLTDEQAKAMLRDFQDIQTRRARIQTNYSSKFQRAIGAKKTLRFYQLENRMDAVVNYELAGVLPLAK